MPKIATVWIRGASVPMELLDVVDHAVLGEWVMVVVDGGATYYLSNANVIYVIIEEDKDGDERKTQRSPEAQRE